MERKPDLLWVSPPFYFVPNRLRNDSINPAKKPTRKPIRVNRPFLEFQNEWIQYLESIKHEKTMQQFSFVATFDSNSNNYLFSKLLAYENFPPHKLGTLTQLKNKTSKTDVSVFCFTCPKKKTMLLMPFKKPRSTERFEDIRDLANNTDESCWRKVMQLILVGVQLFRSHSKKASKAYEICVDGRAQQTLHIRLVAKHQKQNPLIWNKAKRFEPFPLTIPKTLLSQTNTPSFTLITMRSCPWCQKAITLLTDKKWAFQNHAYYRSDVDLEKIKQLLDQQTVPIVLYCNVKLGGYTDLKLFLEKTPLSAQPDYRRSQSLTISYLLSNT